MQSESSPIVRLSMRDIAPADRLNYANWIDSVADGAATTEVSARDPSAFELEATALELPAVTIVAMSGSPQHSVRRFGPRRTVERTFGLDLVFSGSRHVTHGTRYRLGPGDLHFTDSRHPFDYDFLTNWKDCFCAAAGTIRAQMGAQSYRAGVDRIGDSQWGRVLASYFAQLSPEFPRARSAAPGGTARSTRSVIGLDRERAKREPRRINTSRTLRARPRLRSHPTALR